jgi:hypothetical protein
VRKTLEIVRSSEFRGAVDQLPGYQSNDAGSVLTLRQAFGGPVKRSVRPNAAASASASARTQIE